MNRITTRLLAGALFCGLTTTATAQVSAADSVMNHVKGNRLSLGGYGEAAFSRNFYSDNGNRYTTPQSWAVRHSPCSNLPWIRLRKRLEPGFRNRV